MKEGNLMAARRIEMKIDKCSDCPHFCHYHFYHYYCSLTNKELSFKQVKNGIPDNCPLPIAKEDNIKERIEDIINGDY